MRELTLNNLCCKRIKENNLRYLIQNIEGNDKAILPSGLCESEELKLIDEAKDKKNAEFERIKA